MMFRGKILRTEAAPVRGGWVPVVWHGLSLIGCYETCATREEAKSSARWHALQWYRQECKNLPLFKNLA